jgi:hypothetical protein
MTGSCECHLILSRSGSPSKTAIGRDSLKIEVRHWSPRPIEMSLWVISGQTTAGQNPRLSALVRKRTNAGTAGLSAKCQKRTFAPQQIVSLFDHPSARINVHAELDRVESRLDFFLYPATTFSNKTPQKNYANLRCRYFILTSHSLPLFMLMARNVFPNDLPREPKDPETPCPESRDHRAQSGRRN